MQTSCRPPQSTPACSLEPSGIWDGGGGEKRESWIFGEGSRVEEAPVRVTSQWASGPDMAGKELT